MRPHSYVDWVSEVTLGLLADNVYSIEGSHSEARDLFTRVPLCGFLEERTPRANHSVRIRLMSNNRQVYFPIVGGVSEFVSVNFEEDAAAPIVERVFGFAPKSLKVFQGERKTPQPDGGDNAFKHTAKWKFLTVSRQDYHDAWLDRIIAVALEHERTVPLPLWMHPSIFKNLRGY